MILEGRGDRLDISRALLDVEVVNSFSTAWHVTVTFQDVDRKVVNWERFDGRVTVQVDGDRFVVVGLSKAGSQVAITAEHEHVVALRDVDGELTARKGIVTAEDWARRLCRDTSVPVADVDVAEPDDPQYQRDEEETSWEALRRLSDETDARLWVDRDGLHLVADRRLTADPVQLREFTAGVDVIDFDADRGRTVDDATIELRTREWDSLRPGHRVQIRGLRPMRGTWLVSGVSSSLFRVATTVDMTRRR